ncbi:MAG: SDR family oxidoreductase [Acidobacteriota bacterium]
MTERRCLVLGGSGALGRVVCAMLRREGARVAFSYHTGEAIAGDLRSQDMLPFRLDFRDTASIDGVVSAAAEALGGLDALVQCAGVSPRVECAGEASHHRMPHVDEEEWARLMDVNVKSTFFACRSAIAPMRAGGGNVVLMGSVDAVKPAPTPVHYAASKGALRAMTQAMAKELGEQGIKVNMVAPGIMEGGASRDLPQNVVSEYLKHSGLKRVARFSEVAALVTWLALENTYVTGQTILLDGAL